MRPPDFKVGEKYLSRWHLVPRNNLFNIYLHRFQDSDDGRALHDHPYWSMSILLKGKLKEIMPQSERYIRRYIPVIRRPEQAHRLVLESDDAWTIFITGPRIRVWGFWCGNNWVKHSDFTALDENGNERGCG